MPARRPAVQEDLSLRRWLLLGATALLGFLLLMVLVLHGGEPSRLDRLTSTVARWSRTAGRTGVARVAASLGSLTVVLAASAVAAGILWERTGRLRRPAALLAVLLLTVSVVYLLKVAVGRRVAVTSFLGDSSSSSFAFPSAQTADATVVYLLAVLLLTSAQRPVRRIAALAVAVALIFAVGLGRIYLGLQSATDVLGGWLLGTAIATFAYAVLLGLSAWPLAAPEPTSSTAHRRLPGRTR